MGVEDGVTEVETSRKWMQKSSEKIKVRKIY